MVVGAPADRAARDTTGNLLSSSSHWLSPIACGQKYLSCRMAAAWNVNACTALPDPAIPSERSRVRISPAARAVNVTAST